MMEHPLDKFAYCPACGSSHFFVNDEKSKRCADCGFVYYANASAATAAFIVRRRPGASDIPADTPDCSLSERLGDGNYELLVAVRGKEPARGTLDLPGGFVDMNETCEEGLAREVREETGLEISSKDYLFSIPNRYPYSGFTVHTVDMFYLVSVAPGVEPVAGDDASSLRWVPLSELRPELFGLNSISQAVRRFLTTLNVFLT